MDIRRSREDRWPRHDGDEPFLLAYKSQVATYPVHLQDLPWDVTGLIFEELDTASLVAATVSGARAHALPEPLERISRKLCRRHYERFSSQVTYPHRRTSDVTRKNTWSVLLAEQETLKRTEPVFEMQTPQSPNCAKLFLKLAKLLPLWETANPVALSSFWSRFHKSSINQRVLAESGERALLYLGLIEAKHLRPASHSYYCALALAQMRRSPEALDAFERALGAARCEEPPVDYPLAYGSRFSGHLSRSAIVFSMWFIGLWLDLPSLAARAERDVNIHPYDQIIGKEMLDRLTPGNVQRLSKCSER